MKERPNGSSFDSSAIVSLGTKAAGNVLIIGEKLRHNLNATGLIKDRRYHLRSYQQCFVGREVTDWLVKQDGVKGRETAVNLMNILHKYNILHHVCDDHLFKDDMLFYRFRVEDKTLPQTTENKAYILGAQIFYRLTSETSSNPLLKLHVDEGNQYERSFYGVEFVTWLLKMEYCRSRDEALQLGKDLLEADIIRHVTLDHHFKDERHLYQFHTVMTDLGVNALVTLDLEVSGSVAGEMSLLSIQDPGDLLRKHSNSSSSDSSMDKIPITGSKQDLCSSSDQNQNKVPCLDSQDTPTRTFLSPSRHSYTSLELRQEDSPFTKHQIKITGDSVGFGLVIRGNGPTYVQTVDPTGPAAAAGLKVRQYLASVNGVDVLDKSHTEVAKHILSNPYALSLTILQFNGEASAT